MLSNMKFKIETLKNIITLLFITICINFSTVLHAEPKQRLIIHFNHQVNSDNFKSIHDALKNVTLGNYSLLENSSNIRWIIIFDKRIEAAELNRIKSDLLKNKHIKQIENDNLLQRK